MSTSSTRVQQPQNMPVRRTKQMVRLWLIFVIVALISEAISYIINYPTAHYTRIDPVWAATIIFGMDAACFAAGVLWLGRGSRPISRVIYGSAVRTPTPVTTSSTTPPRRINRYLRPQLVEEMVALHQAGQTVAQIASRFGFHRTTVARHLKQAGETLRTNPAAPAFQEQVRQVYAELGTVKHTAQRLGVSKDTVRKVVRGE